MKCAHWVEHKLVCWLTSFGSNFFIYWQQQKQILYFHLSLYCQDIVKGRIKQLEQELSDFDSYTLFEKERHNNMAADLKAQLQRAYDENSKLSPALASAAPSVVSLASTDNASTAAAPSIGSSEEVDRLTAELNLSKKAMEEWVPYMHNIKLDKIVKN